MEEVFFSIARDIKHRLANTDSSAEVSGSSPFNIKNVETISYAVLSSGLWVFGSMPFCRVSS